MADSVQEGPATWGASGGDFDEAADAQANPEIRVVTVGTAQHGERLDKALAQLVPEFSRSYLQQLLAVGALRLNKQAASRSSLRVKVGDCLELEMRPTQESQAFRPEHLALEVVYQDSHVLVINKPAGLVVHPAPGNWSGTLLNALLGRDPDAVHVPRAGIVHRLDKDTSGLMVVARTRATMDTLVRMIGERQVHRQYLAMARGQWLGSNERQVDVAIGRDSRNRLRMAAVDLTGQSGKSARTDLHLLHQGQDHCLVRCILHTGRTHQIRVHMGHIGLPLVGDTLYGGKPELGLTRQALHASRLAFHHPENGRPLVFDAGAPDDLLHAMKLAGVNSDFVQD